jgi:short-subunit dehydrogenase
VNGAPLRVFITGASSGIGAALAAQYDQRGAVLGLLSRRTDALATVCRGLRSVCVPYSADVRDPLAVQAAAQDFCGRFGGADVVIANAGVSAGTLTERPEDQKVFEEVMATNVVGMFNTFQPFVAGMRAAATGVLVGVASVAGLRGLPGAGAYSGSKAAAIAYLESLRVELRGSGVAVVTICPGYVATPMTARNPYAMPFLLPADAAARRMLRAIDRRAPYAIIPWQMRLVGSLLRVVPVALYDALFARAPRKPRR